MENEGGQTLFDAIELTKEGAQHYEKGHFTEAFEKYKRALEIRKERYKGTLALADSYNNFGTACESLGFYDDALANYNRAVFIQKSKAPDGFEIAGSYNNIGSVYSKQGRLDDALEQYKKAFAIYITIKEDQSDFALANCCNNIGLICLQKGYFEKAVKFFNIDLKMQQKNGSSDLDISVSYNNIGDAYRLKGDLGEALKYFGIAAGMQEKFGQIPALAVSYNNMALIYVNQGKVDQAIAMFEKAIKIQEALPNKINLATSYHNMGLAYSYKNDHEKALDLFEKSYGIKAQYVSSWHPDLINGAENIASNALKLGRFDLALKYVDIIIRQDSEYKYAYDLRGQILVKLGRLDDALNCFNWALGIDPGYGDAKIHRLDLLTRISEETLDQEEKVEKTAKIYEELEKAKSLKKTNFDEQYKAALQERVIKDSGDVNAKVELPKEKYQVGDEKYFAALRALEKRVAANENKIRVVEDRVGELESRMDILDGEVYQLAHSMGIIEEVVDDIDRKIDENSSDDEKVLELMEERSRMKTRESHIKEFNKDPDLRHYYHCVLSEIEAIYIAAQAVALREVEQRKKSSGYSKAAKYLGGAVSLAPLIGNLASKIIKSAASLADASKNAISQEELARVRDLAPTVGDFDKIALRIAVSLTLANFYEIKSLKGAKIEDNWKDHIKSYFKSLAKFFTKKEEEGLESMMEDFIRKNDTKAKILGRADAHKVIKYLKQEAVAENLCYLEGTGEGDRHKTRHSLIDEDIMSHVLDERHLSNIKAASVALKGDVGSRGSSKTEAFHESNPFGSEDLVSFPPKRLLPRSPRFDRRNVGGLLSSDGPPPRPPKSPGIAGAVLSSCKEGPTVSRNSPPKPKPLQAKITVSEERRRGPSQFYPRSPETRRRKVFEEVSFRDDGLKTPVSPRSSLKPPELPPRSRVMSENSALRAGPSGKAPPLPPRKPSGSLSRLSHQSPKLPAETLRRNQGDGRN